MFSWSYGSDSESLLRIKPQAEGSASLLFTFTDLLFFSSNRRNKCFGFNKNIKIMTLCFPTDSEIFPIIRQRRDLCGSEENPIDFHVPEWKQSQVEIRSRHQDVLLRLSWFISIIHLLLFTQTSQKCQRLDVKNCSSFMGLQRNVPVSIILVILSNVCGGFREWSDPHAETLRRKIHLWKFIKLEKLGGKQERTGSL